ncbi:cyclin-T [Phthorimaea operculella]|nr:cyclin-T [Phthorimaea operculella]
MAGGQEKWYFTREQLANSPSKKCGLDADKELAYRQQAANLIQDMGQRLQVSQLCINTAIVYMHRFYAFHSFTQFHRNAIAAAALFLAAKVEEQPRKLEYVIKVAHVCLHRGESTTSLTPEQYQEQAQDLVFNENVLLQTLGFDVAIDHPHTHVVRTCHLVKAPKDLAQTSYFMASNSLHLTTMCLQYRPTVVACFCIHLASKWSNWAIPQSSEGRHWFSYVDRSVSSELLERLTAEFLHIFDKCPSRLKRKMMSMNNGSPNAPMASSSASASGDKKHVPGPVPPSTDEFDKAFDKEYERARRHQPVPGGPSQSAPQKIPNIKEERREESPHKKRPDPSTAIKEMQPPTILSPFSSPPLVKQEIKQEHIKQEPKRQRHQSSSEPELVPVVKKLDETPGYENLLRDTQRSQKRPEVKLERKPEPVPSRSLNGIETDPTLVSNLLKESLAKPAPITVPTERKNRDKSKEERKKHKKDKDRDKKKEAEAPPPPQPEAPANNDGALRITIPRDKLSSSPQGLKIKIPKERLAAPPPPPQTSGLKIKISKEVLETSRKSPGFKIKIPKERLAAPPPPPQTSGLKIKISKEVLETSRKRSSVPEAGPPHKMPRQNGSHPKVEPPVGNGHGK